MHYKYWCDIINITNKTNNKYKKEVNDMMLVLIILTGIVLLDSYVGQSTDLWDAEMQDEIKRELHI